MSKKSLLYYGACTVVGFAIGYFLARSRVGQITANTIDALRLADLAEAEERAQKAYQHEEAPVAIYALKEALKKETAAEKIGETPCLSLQAVSIDLMLTHARLANVYEKSGQTNLSAHHIEEALRRAETYSNLAITNRDTLAAFVAKMDAAAK